MNKLFLLFILAAAFGIIEGSVAIYLRPVFNQADFNFEIKILQPEKMNGTQKKILATEVWREFFTLILIGAAAAIAADSIIRWAGYYVFIFSIWDLFYYLWIFMRVNWPTSLFSWDILFLIPKMWLAPVIVPILISTVGLVISLMVIRILDKFRTAVFDLQHWVPLVLALVFWLISFLNKSSAGMTDFPQNYSWSLFIIGMIFALAGGGTIYWDFFINRKKWIFK